MQFQPKSTSHSSQKWENYAINHMEPQKTSDNQNNPEHKDSFAVSFLCIVTDKVLILFSACGHPVILVILVEDAFFSPSYFLIYLSNTK